MKNFKLTTLLIATLLMSSCNSSAQKADKDAEILLQEINLTDLKNASKLTELLKDHVKNQAQIMNEALISYDFETVYNYIPQEDLKGQSVEEFVKSSQDYKKLMSKSVSERKTVVEAPHKIVHCESGFYSLLNQTWSEKINGDVSSRKTQLMGVSADGIHWRFYNMGVLNAGQIKKLHPKVCEELFVP